MSNRHTLRDYQAGAVDQVIASLPSNPVLVAPTGSGKTVMGVALVERVGVPVLWLAHRKELIDQAAERLAHHGLTVGIIMAGHPRHELAPVQVASVQTLARRVKPPVGLIVIDEAHHTVAASYGAILEKYPGVPRVGLTATPFRLDGRGLGDVFGKLIVAAYTDDLCDAGYLHQPRVWASKAPDLRGVKMTGGDYNKRALAKQTNTAELTADIVKTWQIRAAGQRTVAFAVDIAHAESIAQAFTAGGVAAEVLSGKTRRDDRERILARLASGRTQVVANCMVLTEGWDCPTLECAILARPTASLNLHLQMIGRIMRASPGKIGAIVLDHAGNHHVHGMVTRRLEYSLDGKKKIGETEPLGLRRCRACGLFFDPSEYACPECGWTPEASEYQTRKSPGVKGPGELAEFDDESWEYRANTWRTIEAQRMASGYKPGWSFYRFNERFGVSPVVDDAGELVNPHKATTEQKRSVYQQFAEVGRQRGYAHGWASHRYRDVFGVWPRGVGVADARRRSADNECENELSGAAAPVRAGR